MNKIEPFVKWAGAKAKDACAGSKQDVSYHFVDVNRVADFGGVAPSNIQDIVLSRYACYLIAMNGDSRKKAIAFIDRKTTATKV